MNTIIKLNIMWYISIFIVDVFSIWCITYITYKGRGLMAVKTTSKTTKKSAGTKKTTAKAATASKATSATKKAASTGTKESAAAKKG